MALRFGLPELGRSRFLRRLPVFHVSFDGRKVEVEVEVDGQELEFKAKISQSKAREADLPGGRQIPRTQPDGGRTGIAGEPAAGYPESRQVAAPDKPVTREEESDDITLEPPQMAADEDSASVNFWKFLRPDQRQAFTAVAVRRVFVTGARLMEEGEAGDHVAVITGGLAEVRVRENGTERVVAHRGRGQLIGERAALEMNPRSATVVAVGTVEALAVRTADFAAFVERYPEVLKLVEEQIFDRMKEDRPGPGRVELAGRNCTVIRTDIAGFSLPLRNDEDRETARAALEEMTESVLGPIWQASWREDRGDGDLIVVPASIPTADVLSRLSTGLPPRIRAHNRIHREPTQIRLRVAVEVGPVEQVRSRVRGKAIINTARMVDAPDFKQAMTDRGVEFGLIVSPFVYQAHIEARGGQDGFTEVAVRIKEADGPAWMQLTAPAPAPRHLMSVG